MLVFHGKWDLRSFLFADFYVLVYAEVKNHQSLIDLIEQSMSKRLRVNFS